MWKSYRKNYKMEQINYNMTSFCFKHLGTFPLSKMTAYNIMLAFLPTKKYVIDNYKSCKV